MNHIMEITKMLSNNPAEKVSIIICAYNEANTIAGVIESVLKINLHDELIVVNDGSTDISGSIIQDLNQKNRFKYINLPKNKGKSFAMYKGIISARNDILLFMDADISAIREDHLKSLITPILNNQADMILGQPSETLIDYGTNPFKSFTGERCLRKSDIRPVLDKIKDQRFGVETFLNLYYQSKGKRVKNIMLAGLIHPTKYSKTGPVKATFEFIGEGKEIGVTLLKNYDLIVKSLAGSLKRITHTNA